MPELGLAGLEVPVLLIGAVVVITMATWLLHLIFPPAKRPDPRRLAPPSMPTSCPSCQERLEEVEHRGIGIEVCPRCHGVWLSQGKLERLVN